MHGTYRGYFPIPRYDRPRHRPTFVLGRRISRGRAVTRALPKTEETAFLVRRNNWSTVFVKRGRICNSRLNRGLRVAAFAWLSGNGVREPSRRLVLPGRAIGYPCPTATHVLHPYVTDHCLFFQRKLAENHRESRPLFNWFPRYRRVRSPSLLPSPNDIS